MACPLFLPAASLGDYFAGECSSGAGEAIPPETLRVCCNRGYARNSCTRAAEAEADCIQFVVRADRDGEIELGWAIERNHHPVAVGSVVLPKAVLPETVLTGAMAPETPSTPLEFQALAFGEAYRRHKKFA